MLDTVRNYSIGTFIWGSPIVFFVWGLPYSSNRHVTPVSVRGRKGLTCSIRAPHCPRFDILRQSVSNYFWLCMLKMNVFTFPCQNSTSMPSRKTRNAHVGRQKVLSQHFRTASSRPLISAAVYAMTPLR